MVEILPAILEKSMEAIQEKLARLESIAERVQLDVADGIFVAETSWQDLSQLSRLDSIGYRPPSRGPRPPHDIKVDLIVTEKRVVKTALI